MFPFYIDYLYLENLIQDKTLLSCPSLSFINANYRISIKIKQNKIRIYYQMKNKHKLYLSNQLYPEDSPQKNTTFPIKSPSPDKKRANIITPTRSPQVIQIQRNMTPTKNNYRTVSHVGDTCLPDKSSSTRFHTVNNNSDLKQLRQYTTANKREFSELENIMPEEFIIGHSRARSSYKQNQLDYIRLLQQKERTIKQLHQIIDMINRNNTNTEVLNFTNSQFYDSCHLQNMTLKESYQTVFPKRSNPENRSEHLVQQLKNQIKILTIQNQKLLYMVERQDHSSKVKSQKQSQETLNLQISNRKIQELRQQLFNREAQIYQFNSQNQIIAKKLKKSEEQVRERNQENMKLLKILKEIKDREQSDRRTQALRQSSISSSSNSKNEREKTGLMRIKQQHEENLNTFKNVVYQQAQSMVDSMQNQIEGLHLKLDKMNKKLIQIQKFKLLHGERQSLNQLSQIQIRESEKERHLQIESILLQKNDFQQKQLVSQRQNIQELQKRKVKLQNDKHVAQNKIKQLQEKYSQLWQKYSQLQQKYSQLIIDKSKNSNIQQIQDINYRIKDSQIKKLRELLRQNQKIHNQKIEQLQANLQNMKSQINQREENLFNQRQMYQGKIQDLNQIIQGKSSQIHNIQNHYKQQISNVKTSYTQNSSIVSTNQQLIKKLKMEVIQYQTRLTETQLKIKQNQQRLSQKQRQFESQKQCTKQEVQMLVQNYNKEIQMLRQEISNKQNQIQESATQNNRMAQMLDAKVQLYKQEIEKLQKTIQLHVQQKRQIQKVQKQLNQQLQHYDINVNIKHQNLLNKIDQLQHQVLHNQNLIQQQRIQILNYQKASQANIKLEKNLLELKGELELCQHQIENLRRQKTNLIEQAQTKNLSMLQETERYQVQAQEAQQIIDKLNKQINQHRINIHSLHGQNLLLQNNFNQIIRYKKETHTILPQLYELKQLISQSALHKANGDRYNLESFDKMQLEFQQKIEQVKNLNNQIAELRDLLVKQKQSRQLVQEKVNFLQKTIEIYENQLKQRKQFCQKLVGQKSKIDRELLYMKKARLDQKSQETNSIKSSLVARVNRLVQLQQNRQKQISVIIQSSRQVSPIKKVQDLTTSVYTNRQ